MEIDRESAVPIAHQLFELIRGQIMRGSWNRASACPLSWSCASGWASAAPQCGKRWDD